MKKPKLPAPFKESLTPVQYDKTIDKCIHTKGEKEFARSLYREQSTEAGISLVFSAELDKKGRKRLKKLASEIKKNRGFVQWGKLAIAAALLVGLTLFYLVFKNPILENLAEQSLAGLFQARVEIDGLDFDPVGGKLKITGMAVANKDKPMENLFQLGTTGMQVDSWRLVNGKVIIEDVRCEDVRFNTKRNSSGALPGNQPSPAPTAAPAQADPAAPMTLSIPGFADLSKLDAAAILEKESANLKSVIMAKALQAEFSDLPAKWQAEVAQENAISKKIDESKAKLGKLVTSGIPSKQALDEAMNSLKSHKDDLALAKDEADKLAQKIKEETKRYEGKLQELKHAAIADKDYLAQNILSPDGMASDMGKSIADQILGPKVWEIYGYIQKMPEVLKALKSDSPPPAPTERRKGRTVRYPTPDLPGFQLRQFIGRVWLDETTALSLTIHNISSEPDKTGAPTTFTAQAEQGTIKAVIDGTIDVRSSAQNSVVIHAFSSGIQLDATPVVASLGFERLTMAAGFDGTFTVEADAPRGNGNGTLKAQLAGDSIQGKAAGVGMLANIGTRFLKALEPGISGQLDGSFPKDGAPSFNFASNIDSIFGNAISSAVQGELDAVKKDLAGGLDKLVENNFGAGKETGDFLKSLASGNGANLANIQNLEKTSGVKLAELEKVAKLLQAKSAVPQLPQVPQVQAPSIKIPGF